MTNRIERVNSYHISPVSSSSRLQKDAPKKETGIEQIAYYQHNLKTGYQAYDEPMECYKPFVDTTVYGETYSDS